MDPAKLLIFGFALAYLAYGAWLLPVLTDWVSSAVDEGYTSYAAQRIREGDWAHRDFFFLWTPGTAYLHALLQGMGAGWIAERAAALVASAGTSVLFLGWASRWSLPKPDRLALAALLFLWGYSLWNIQYSSWYAVFLAALAMRALPRRIFLAGALFGLSFWFKQNVGILAFLGAAVWLLWEKKGRESARFVGAFALVLFIPFLVMLAWGGKGALLSALSQIFLFPLRYPSLMGVSPERAVFAAPLTTLGLWIISLFVLRPGSGGRSASLVQAGVLIYTCVHAARAPGNYALGLFVILSLAALPLALAAEASRRERESLRRFLLLWLPCAGAFLQVFPRLDFQHLLFVFPISAFFFVHALVQLGERYPVLGRGWLRLPLLLLAAAGLFLQAEVQATKREGQEDPLGRISRGAGLRLNEEVAAVGRFLAAEGLKPGDPLLVLPNATSVYQWTGFRNPTPHQQFFPGYVEAFGARQEEVLASYRARGGVYLVVQERSGLEENVPEIFREIERDYEVRKMFPEHFTIYAPRSREQGKRGI